MKIRRSHIPFTLGVPALIWQVLFFYIPLVFIVISSFIRLSEEGTLSGFTFDHIAPFLNPTYFKVIAASLLLALGNALLCFCLAFPVAYFIAFRGHRYKTLLLALLIVPFWTNFLLHIYAWFYVLETHGFLNTLLLKFHLIKEPLKLLNSLFSIGLMMVYFYLPFMFLPIYANLERFNYKLIEASYDLGASFFTTFRKVLLPLCSRGVRAGFFLVFIPSFGEFAIPELMGGDKKMFVGSVVSQYILGEGTGSLGSAYTLVSTVALLLSTGLIFFLLTKALRRGKEHG